MSHCHSWRCGGDGGSGARGLPRNQFAIVGAMINRAVIVALIDQPTMRRENRSITAAR
jgi:hypothetical protein